MKKLFFSLTAAFAMSGALAPDASAQTVTTSDRGYTIDMDFKIESGCLGVIFACPNVSNFYMWQINIEDPSNPQFRPHRWINGGPGLLQEFSIADKVNITQNSEHNLKIVVNDYNSASTYIDGILVDENRPGDYPYGMIGFRQSFFQNTIPEITYVDNIKITRHEDGKVMMDEDFSGTEHPFDHGDVVNGWFKAAGNPGAPPDDIRYFASPYNDVHFSVEADMNLVKDDVAFVFAQQNEGTYYMWAVNCFDGADNPNPRIRHHMFVNNNLNWNDAIFNQYTKQEILGQERHVKIEVVGAYIYTYIDDVLVDRYMDWAENLKPGLVGFRIDTQNEQDDDAYIDNVKVTVYDENDNPEVVLSEDFSNPNLCWFPEAIVEEVNGDRKMHIYGDKVLYKWMQLPELTDEGYTMTLDFEIDQLNAGICFSGTHDLKNYYMWQINNENPSKPMLRPHQWINGNPTLLGEVNITEKVQNLGQGVHTLKLVFSNNSSCATYIDDVLVDSRTGIFTRGLIGFRETHSDEAGTYESAYFDNIRIESNDDDTVYYDYDFSDGNPYSDGEIIEGRLYVKGAMDSDHFAWQCDYNDVWYTLEADMTLVKDDVAFIFSHINDDNYYMWSVDAFDRDEMMIRAHIWENGQVRYDDISFFNFSKQDILGSEHHVKIEVRGALISTYIDDQLVNRYVSFSDNLVLADVGIRIDTRSSQDDDAYIDNVKVTEYRMEPDTDITSGNARRAATLTSNVVLEDDFENLSSTWFPDAFVEYVNSSNKMHIYTPEDMYPEGALLKWMQAPQKGVNTGIHSISDKADNGTTEYFNLQGIRVANPQPGVIYIVRKGGKASKQIIR